MGAPRLLVYINYGFASPASARAEQLSRCVLIIIPVTVINNQAVLYSCIINCYIGTAFCSPDSFFDTPNEFFHFQETPTRCVLVILKRFSYNAQRLKTRISKKNYYY